MPLTSVKDLRRIIEAVEQLRSRTVSEVNLRSDCRQIRLQLDDGRMLLVSAALDESDAPRLEIDVLRAPDQVGKGQLEVRFDA